jgi:hypothetical protein
LKQNRIHSFIRITNQFQITYQEYKNGIEKDINSKFDEAFLKRCIDILIPEEISLAEAFISNQIKDEISKRPIQEYYSFNLIGFSSKLEFTIEKHISENLSQVCPEMLKTPEYRENIGKFEKYLYDNMSFFETQLKTEFSMYQEQEKQKWEEEKSRRIAEIQKMERKEREKALKKLQEEEERKFQMFQNQMNQIIEQELNRQKEREKQLQENAQKEKEFLLNEIDKAKQGLIEEKENFAETTKDYFDSLDGMKTQLEAVNEQHRLDEESHRKENWKREKERKK